MLRLKKFHKFFQHGSKGFSLIEVIIAMALLGIIGIAILGGLATASRTIFIADEQATAESLARSQMEAIKKAAYDAINNPPNYSTSKISGIPAGYDITITAQRLNPKGDDPNNDDGIQLITVRVYHDDPNKLNPVLKLEGYKVDR